MTDMKRETRDKIIFWVTFGTFAAAILACGMYGLMTLGNY